jgi:hypothetical protein
MSMYNSSIPVFIRHLGNLSGLLDSAATYVTEQDIDESVLSSARLFPNMLPLIKQVQIACDMVTRGGARLAGVEAPTNEDSETTFAELKARIESTQVFLQGLSEENINSSADNNIVMPAGPYELTFSGEEYLNLWILPNMYFHISTTYNILRHNGVTIGKLDFLGLDSFIATGP